MFDEADPEMVQTNLRLSEAFLADIDATWMEQGFNSRSEFLRYVARDAVRRPNFPAKDGQIVESEHDLRAGESESVSREEALALMDRDTDAE